MRNTGYITCVSHGGQHLEGPHAFLVAQMLKNPPVVQETQGRIPGVKKIFWRRNWLPNPIFSPGDFHELRSLAGYSPWSLKELNTTE